MKMEIELTEEQAEKVEILKENGIEVGQAIDILFDMKESFIATNNKIIDHRIQKANKEKAELEEKLSQVDGELERFNKLKDSSMDPAQKQKIVEKEYSLVDDNPTYDKTVHDQKTRFKWSKNFFKF